MGFDLYGLKPQLTETRPELDWAIELSEKEREKYFALRNKWEKNNPGAYFRNNVWSWRPLWSYICQEVAPDILTEEDMERGEHNDGHCINAIKANYIADKIGKLDATGKLEAFDKKYKKSLDALPKEECKHCNGSGVRNDQHVQGKCNACENGMKDPWAKSYPFSAENVRDFATFSRSSGGFEIC